MVLRLAVLCGGRSGEHEVSLQSAYGIFNALDRKRFEPLLVAIDKEGVWRMGDADSLLLDPRDPERIRLAAGSPAVVPTLLDGRCRLLSTEDGKRLAELDAVLPIIHGTDGEDGALQGLLQLLDVPYVGADVTGSVLGMDKDVGKRLLAMADLPVAPYRAFRGRAEAEAAFEDLSQSLGLPLFVKPANLGSSVGVTRAGDRAEYLAAVAEAFAFGEKIVVEQAVPGREVECSVLGSPYSEKYPPAASRVGEIRPRDGFYSYRAKYLDPEGAELIVPADLPPEVEERVRELSLRVFDVMECDGMARVDFFVRDNGGVLVNELNTLPGFTPISMYPKLWEASGLSYTELLTRLVELALERAGRRGKLRREFDLGGAR